MQSNRQTKGFHSCPLRYLSDLFYGMLGHKFLASFLQTEVCRERCVCFDKSWYHKNTMRADLKAVRNVKNKNRIPLRCQEVLISAIPWPPITLLLRFYLGQFLYKCTPSHLSWQQPAPRDSPSAPGWGRAAAASAAQQHLRNPLLAIPLQPQDQTPAFSHLGEHNCLPHFHPRSQQSTDNTGTRANLKHLPMSLGKTPKSSPNAQEPPAHSTPSTSLPMLASAALTSASIPGSRTCPLLFTPPSSLWMPQVTVGHSTP